jgi:hypothetical protein
MKSKAQAVKVKETFNPDDKNKIIALNVAEKPSVARAICDHLSTARSGVKSY